MPTSTTDPVPLCVAYSAGTGRGADAPVRGADPGLAYTLFARSGSHPGVSRTLEVLGSSTTCELQALLEEEFALEESALPCLYLSGVPWDEPSAVECASDPGDAEEVPLDALALTPGAVIAHVQDACAPRCLLIEVRAVAPDEPGATYPRVVAREGEPPPRGADDAPAPAAPPLAGAGPVRRDVAARMAAIRNDVCLRVCDGMEPPLLRGYASDLVAALRALPPRAVLAPLDPAFCDDVDGAVPPLADELRATPEVRALAPDVLDAYQRHLGWDPFPHALLAALCEELPRHDLRQRVRASRAAREALAALLGELMGACPTWDRLAALSELIGVHPLETWTFGAVELARPARPRGGAPARPLAGADRAEPRPAARGGARHGGDPPLRRRARARRGGRRDPGATDGAAPRRDRDVPRGVRGPRCGRGAPPRGAAAALDRSRGAEPRGGGARARAPRDRAQGGGARGRGRPRGVAAPHGGQARSAQTGK